MKRTASKVRKIKNHRLSLAYSDLDRVPEEILAGHGEDIHDLDLSHNRISDLSFLTDLPHLQSLILDDNRVTSHVKMPLCEKLEILWVNDNRIQKLDTFLRTLARKCPNLKFLSMMNNEAARSYFNGGTYQQYLDYRYYVIKRLPHLEVLDYSRVTSVEERKAREMYAPVLFFFPRKYSR